MNDTVNSMIRTLVPIIVGALVSWLLTRGVVLAPDAEAGLIVSLTALMQALYYIVVRSLERYLPTWLTRFLLGSAKTPTYDKEP